MNKVQLSAVLAVAMVAGAFGAGCKSQDKISDKGNDVEATESAATPEDSPDSAPVSDTEKPAPTGTEKDAYWGHAWAGHAPPALRVEAVGPARAGHFWRPGYYGWGGRDYRWYGGAYYPERPGYRYVNPSWYGVGSRWGYRRGYWVGH
jgi:hypothetical protein